MKKILFLIFAFLALPALVFATDKININTATLSQLDELTGIGPTYAQRIIDGRPYASVDDLDRVKGIGPATLQKIKDQGLACVNCQTSTPVPIPTSTPTPNPNPTPTPTTSLATAIVYPNGIFINEILPSPKGSDETDEYIELFNSNNFEVDLTGWKISDTAGTISTFTISQGTRMAANGYKLFTRPETKIMLNNGGDGLNLLLPDGKSVYSIGFTNAPVGQSYNRDSNDWAFSTTLTPGVANIITAAPKVLPKAKKSATNNIVEAKDFTADLSLSAKDLIKTDQTSQEKNFSPWFLFFIVLAVTIILALAVLIIKFKLNKTNVRT